MAKRKTTAGLRQRRGRLGGHSGGDGARAVAPPDARGIQAAGGVKATVGKREASSAVRREAILTAALDEFSARGFEAARLDDVAKRAGVAKGTIYLYFRDKESLFQELISVMLAPLVAIIERMGAADVPIALVSEHIVDMFVREVYETRRKDVIRLILSEGRRFPHIAEFYYREVLSRIIAAVRALLRRAAARGEVPAGLVDFPQLIAAPGLIAVIWSGLFDRFEPLDVRAMMKTHTELLFGSRRAT
jgi:AcrR family transcriptional regulator